MMLDELCSCEFVKVSKPKYILYALLWFILGALLMSAGEQIGRSVGSQVYAFGICALFAGVAYGIAYFLSRHAILSFRSPAAGITIYLHGQNINQAPWYIGEVEAAKNARYMLLVPAATANAANA